MRMKKTVLLWLMSMTLVMATSCGKENGKDEPSVPEQKYEQPVTHVYSDDDSSEATVMELRNDGTVVLDASTAKVIPQKGEIIVSGITEAAPEGFLYHVENVQQSDGKIVVKTSPATLNEVLPDSHFEEPLEFALADDETEAQTVPWLQSVAAGGMRGPKSFDLLHYNANVSLKKDLGSKVSFSKFEKSEYVKADGNIDVRLGGSFIWDSKDGVTERCGMTLNGSVGAKINMEAAVKVAPNDIEKYRFKFPLETKLKPIVVLVGHVPVVLVPTVQYYIGVMSSSGKIYAKWKLLDFDALGFDARMIWSRDPNNSGGHFDCGFTPKTDFVSKDWKDYFTDLLNAEVGLEGEVKFAVWPYLRFKLYNTESVSIALGLAGYAGVKGQIGWKYQADYFTWDDYDIKDNFSVSTGISVPYEGKFEFKVFGKKIGGTWAKSLDVLQVPLVESGTCFPDFSDFVMTPVEDAKNYQNVHVSALRGTTKFALFSAWESDYGFCYAKVGKDASGNASSVRSWKFVSLKSNYAATSSAFTIETDLPTADLEANTTYEVRPYWTMQMGSLRKVCLRKGGKFKTGNATSGGVIIDVPGTIL